MGWPLDPSSRLRLSAEPSPSKTQVLDVGKSSRHTQRSSDGAASVEGFRFDKTLQAYSSLPLGAGSARVGLFNGLAILLTSPSDPRRYATPETIAALRRVGLSYEVIHNFETKK